jgi:hypothetical protein
MREYMRSKSLYIHVHAERERGYVHTQRTSRDTCAALRLLVSFRSHIRVLFCFAAQLFDSNTLPACWCCSCDTSFCSILLGGTCRAGERAALRPCWRQEATQQRLKGFYCENSGKRAMKQCWKTGRVVTYLPSHCTFFYNLSGHAIFLYNYLTLTRKRIWSLYLVTFKLSQNYIQSDSCGNYLSNMICTCWKNGEFIIQ